MSLCKLGTHLRASQCKAVSRRSASRGDQEAVSVAAGLDCVGESTHVRLAEPVSQVPDHASNGVRGTDARPDVLHQISARDEPPRPSAETLDQFERIRWAERADL